MSNEKKGPRGPQSIFIKVLTGYVAVTLLVVVLAGLVSYGLVGQSVIETNLADLQHKAEQVAEMMGRPDGRVRMLTPKGLYEIEALCDAQLIYVDSDMVTRQMPTKQRQQSDVPGGRIWEERGKKWFETMPAPPNSASSDAAGLAQAEEAQAEDARDDAQTLQRVNLAGSVDEQLVRSIMGGEPAVDVRKLQFIGVPVMFAGTPIVDVESGDVLAAIILCRPLADASPATARVLWMLALAGAVAILCAVVLAWFMSRRIARPITDISTIAERMAQGHYGERCQILTRDEIGHLGGTLNLLSARLNDVIGTLNDEKSKLETILSAIGEGIIAIDRDGRVIHYNAAALNLLELKAWEVHPGNPLSLEHQRQLIDMMRRSMAGNERIMTSWDMVTGRTIEAIASPVVRGGDELIGSVCLVRDISEAQRIEQMRRDYIANISHELRTPLTGIRGMVEPLLDGLMETEQERQDCYQIIYQETIRLEKLIGDMLDLSRLQAGRIALELEAMEPEGLLEAAARRLKGRAEEGGVTIGVSVEEPGLVLMGDEDRILQVLTILADNAVSFTPPGGAVTLFCHRAGTGVALGVRDTGAGIDPVDLPYIWERFYKADRSRMRTSGTGLGLPIAKLTVELMQGEIDVRTQVGKGSTFTIVLKGGACPE